MTSLDSPRSAALSSSAPSALNTNSFEAFVCCTQAETNQANAIRMTLEQGGVRCAISPPDIRAGHKPVMILLLTRATSESRAIESEVGRAVYRGFPLIVVRLDSIPVGKRLSYHLSQRPFQRVDAVEPPLTQHLARLMQIVESALGIAAGEAVAAPRLQGALPPISSGADAKAATAKGSPLRERVAFISYSDADEVASHGALLGLRSRIHSELQIQIGGKVRLWQNALRIPFGADWKLSMSNAIAESDFLIAVVTPEAMVSESCGVEYRCFLERESVLGRRDLVFPLLYIDVPGLGADDVPSDDYRMRLIAERGWFDWRELRDKPVISPEVAKSAAEFCGGIAARLNNVPASA